MKLSILGALSPNAGTAVIALLSTFDLWAPPVYHNEEHYFSFETWVSTESERIALFDSLKPFVDTHGGSISWHQCSHDEAIRTPCVIAETYTGG